MHLCVLLGLFVWRDQLVWCKQSAQRDLLMQKSRFFTKTVLLVWYNIPTIVIIILFFFCCIFIPLNSHISIVLFMIKPHNNAAGEKKNNHFYFCDVICNKHVAHHNGKIIIAFEDREPERLGIITFWYTCFPIYRGIDVFLFQSALSVCWKLWIVFCQGSSFLYEVAAHSSVQRILLQKGNLFEQFVSGVGARKKRF